MVNKIRQSPKTTKHFNVYNKRGCHCFRHALSLCRLEMDRQEEIQFHFSNCNFEWHGPVFRIMTLTNLQT